MSEYDEKLEDHAMDTGVYRDLTVKSWCAHHRLPYCEHGEAALRQTIIAPAHAELTPSLVHEAMRYVRPAVFYAGLEDVTLMPRSGYACTSDGYILYRELGYQASDPAPGLGGRCLGVDPDGTVKVNQSGDGQLVSEECIFLGGQQNFGHFVIENLTRLAMIDRLPAHTRNLPVVVYNDLPKRYYEFLELCGIERNRLKFISPSPAYFSKVWIVSSPFFRPGKRAYDFCWWADAVWHLRHVASRQMAPRESQRLKLYLHRANAKWRRIVNDGAVTDLVRQHGYIPVALEEMAASQQLELILNARSIVAAAGATEAITIFAQPECHIIELMPPRLIGEAGSMCFAAILGQPFTRLRGRSANNETAERTRIERDFVIDCGALEEALRGTYRAKLF